MTNDKPGDAIDLLRYFPAEEASAWLEAVTADLKGRSVDEAVTWSPAPHVYVRALYGTADALPDPAGTLRYIETAGWTACAWVGGADEHGFADRVTAADAGGADAIACSLAGAVWPLASLPVFAFPSEPIDAVTIPESASGAIFLRRANEKQPVYLNALIDAIWRTAPAIRRRSPRMRALGIDLTPIASASLAVQLAVALSLTRRHIDRGLEVGWALVDILAGIQFVVPSGRFFFPELTRFRALRALVGQIALAYQPGLKSLPALSILAETERCSGDDPHTHALRTTPMALAALLGGCSALIVHPGDDTPAWDRLALNTHHILRHEAHIGRVADAGAGSYYIEHLTDALARRAWRLFQNMERSDDVALSDTMLHAYDTD